jgi:hypothetical protein
MISACRAACASARLRLTGTRIWHVLPRPQTVRTWPRRVVLAAQRHLLSGERRIQELNGFSQAVLAHGRGVLGGTEATCVRALAIRMMAERGIDVSCLQMSSVVRIGSGPHTFRADQALADEFALRLMSNCKRVASVQSSGSKPALAWQPRESAVRIRHAPPTFPELRFSTHGVGVLGIRRFTSPLPRASARRGTQKGTQFPDSVDACERSGPSSAPNASAPRPD